jgi:hypothetical protein
MGRQRAKKKLTDAEVFDHLLSRTLGYVSPLRMLADLTPEEYEGWQIAYQQDPWGEERTDQRNAVTFLWNSWRPSYEGEKPNLPNLFFPYWETKEQKVESEVEAYQRLKQQGIEAQQRMKEKKSSGG